MKSGPSAFIAAAITFIAPAAEAAVEDPKHIVEVYYTAISRKDYRKAYLLWDREGQASGKSLAAFRDGFKGTIRSRVVAHAPTNADAGMNQRWIDVPVDVYATLRNGRRQHFRGYYRLHRVVAEVGAPQSAQRWHLYAAKLLPVR